MLHFSVWHHVPMAERKGLARSDGRSCQNDFPCDLAMWDKQLLPNPRLKKGSGGSNSNRGISRYRLITQLHSSKCYLFKIQQFALASVKYQKHICIQKMVAATVMSPKGFHGVHNETSIFALCQCQLASMLELLWISYTQKTIFPWPMVLFICVKLLTHFDFIKTSKNLFELYFFSTFFFLPESKI